MKRPTHTHRALRARRWICALWLAATQAGCGGGGTARPNPEAAPPQSLGSGPHAASVMPAAAGPDVLHDPAAVPIDREAHTRTGLYLRRMTAERVSREREGRVIWIDTTCCPSEEEVELVAMFAYGEQSARGLESDDPPFFVTGGDQRLAARLVDRLGRAGIARAYLVTP